MSETTSPSATIFPKELPPVRSRVPLAEPPDLFVCVSGLTQRLDHVPPQVRHVAGHEAHLAGSTRHQTHLADGGGQYAGLGAPERLRAGIVLYLHRCAAHVREGRKAFRMGRLDAGLR